MLAEVLLPSWEPEPDPEPKEPEAAEPVPERESSCSSNSSRSLEPESASWLEDSVISTWGRGGRGGIKGSAPRLPFNCCLWPGAHPSQAASSHSMTVGPG